MSKSGDDFMAYLVARGAYLRQTVDIKNSENDFLIENGNHNKRLLFYERQKEIIQKIENLDL